MKQSQFFTKTQKNISKDEQSVNAQLLIRGGFVDKLMAGTYSFLPMSLRVMDKIVKVIREEMNEIGGQEIIMPALHPKENWQKTGRWGTFDALIYTGLGEEKDMTLGPTHEEIVAPLAKKFISSYKDLPKYVYQFQTKFRNEKRAKSGILRLREFLMKDLYSFHATQEDLDVYYEKVQKSYAKIFDKLGLGEKTYLTFASGGSFAKYSHEFQTVISAGEDTIYICDKCRIAVNKEIIEELNHQCPQCQNNDLHEEKATEVGNIFKLGTKYSEPFNLIYVNEKGEQNYVIMGCYGIGPQRVMGTIVEAFHDEKGIIWPENVAPFKVHLIEVSSKNKEVSEKAGEIYEMLAKKGVEVLYDDRKETSAGEKFAEADLIGMPYRIVVSERTLKSGGPASNASRSDAGWVEVKKRNEKESRILKAEELVNYLTK